jgi:sugar phosphate isomerase/epimerase
MKLACQDGMAQGTTLPEKLDSLAEAGYEGIEFWGGNLWERVAEINAATANHSVKPSTICAGFKGCPLDADKKERDIASADIHKLLQTAGDLGMVGLIMVPIFGSPRIPDLSPLASPIQLEKDLLYKLMDDWGKTAEKAGTFVLLEPLNRYETHLIKTLQDGVDVCERVGNPHIKIMADFFHMSIEEAHTPDSIRRAGSHIAHVHLADNTRQMPGLGETDFKAGFDALKEIGFTGYMALECGNPDPDKQAGLKKSAEFLKSLL